MGAGQVKYFILIPKNDKNPSPLPSHSKKLRSYWFSTFYGPMTARNYENRHIMSMGFKDFFDIFSGGCRSLYGPAAPRPQMHSSTPHYTLRRELRGHSGAGDEPIPAVLNSLSPHVVCLSVLLQMRRLSSLVLFLLLPVCARSEAIYHIRRLSERELTQTYARLLSDACRHADKDWHDSSTDTRAGYWGTGRSDQQNEGIRAISGMVLACGTLLKYSDALSDSERRITCDQATRAIHYAVSSHLTRTQKCTDGKPWGGSWQSAMWTATLTFGARLIWDDLDPELRQGVERVIASEADSFLKDQAAYGRCRAIPKPRRMAGT